MQPQRQARHSIFISCLFLIDHDILEKDLQTMQIKSKVGLAPILRLSIETKHARQQQQARQSRFISFFIIMIFRQHTIITNIIEDGNIVGDDGKSQDRDEFDRWNRWSWWWSWERGVAYLVSIITIVTIGYNFQITQWLWYMEKRWGCYYPILGKENLFFFYNIKRHVKSPCA